MAIESTPSFYVYYEIKSISEHSHVDSEEERKKQFVKIKDIFTQLLHSAHNQNPKIQIDEQNRRVLCGYKTSKEFKSVFPNCKEFINIEGLCESKKPVLECCKIPSSDYQKILQENAEQEAAALKKERQEFFQEVTAFLSSHTFTDAPLVNISSCQSPQDLIKLFLTNFDAFGVGDSHLDFYTYIFINNHLPLLKELGVTRIFWEGFTGHIESAVSKYFDSSNPLDHFPKKLQTFIDTIQENMEEYWANVHEGTPLSSFPKVRDFFQELKKNNMRFYSLDYPDLTEEENEKVEEAEDRLDPERKIRLMNYYAYKILTQFQKDHPGEKFIFLAGAWHNSMYGKVPGICSLLQCPWILVVDGTEKKEVRILEENTSEAKNLIKKIFYDTNPDHPDPHKYSMRPDAILLGNPFFPKS